MSQVLSTRRQIANISAVVGLVFALAACASPGAPGPTLQPSVAVSPSASLQPGVAASPGASVQPGASAAATPDLSQVALVGQWQLNRTCQAIVDVLTAAGHPELIEQDVGELVEGNVDGNVPPGWDSAHPCVKALPPTPHSHTFWPNGTFNSYDEHGNEVDDAPWASVDADSFTIGSSTFTYTITDGNKLRFEPDVPTSCSGECSRMLWWVYAVSYPGSTWTRITSGPHVP